MDCDGERKLLCLTEVSLNKTIDHTIANGLSCLSFYLYFDIIKMCTLHEFEMVRKFPLTVSKGQHISEK